MKKWIIPCLATMLIISFVISLANSSLGAEEEIHGIVGDFVCVEVDKEGNIKTIEEFSVCNGLLVFVGKDGKIYSVHGSEKEIENLAKNHEKKKVSGRVEGHQRAWRLYASSLEPKETQKSEERTITGTIVCLIPDYKSGNVKPVVASGPCNELEPHAHVIYTREGQIYALHGSEEAIVNIEKSPVRKNVSLKGKVQGNQNAWILFVE
ncbi:MAG: hypothetical protein WBD99_11715 [Thermodesulfobacteriota bacterium]